MVGVRYLVDNIPFVFCGLAISILLAACGVIGGPPLKVNAATVRGEDGRSGIYYKLAPAEAPPSTASPWISAVEWQALKPSEQVEYIFSEKRRGRVILVDGASAYTLPELNLQKPERIDPAFVKTKRDGG